jgi:hypothetical protein
MGAEYPGSARMRGMGWNPYSDEAEAVAEMPGLNDSEQEDMKRWNQPCNHDTEMAGNAVGQRQANETLPGSRGDRMQGNPSDIQEGQSYWNASPSRNGQPYMRCSYLDILEEEEKAEKDLRRLQSMYPQAAREILPMVEDVCDRMEYEGSMMFDESPDRNTIRRMSNEIYRKIRKQYPEGIQPIARDEVLSMQYPGPGTGTNPGSGPATPPGMNPSPGPATPPGINPGPGPATPPGINLGPGPAIPPGPNPGPAPDPDGSFLNNLVQVMLIQEMHRRRCRYNRCRPQNY